MIRIKTVASCKGTLPLMAMFCVAVCLLAVAQEKTSAPADTIVMHAKIYTVNDKQPWAEAIAIRGDKVVAGGSNKEIGACRGSPTRGVYAGGRAGRPGVAESHLHFKDG